MDWVHWSMVDRAKGLCPDLIRAVPYGSGGSRRLHAMKRRRARRREAVHGGDGGGSPEQAELEL
jgi:hypothetical protein